MIKNSEVKPFKVEGKKELESKPKEEPKPLRKKQRPLKKRKQEETIASIIPLFRGRVYVDPYMVSAKIDCHPRTAKRYLKLLATIGELSLKYGILRPSLEKKSWIIEDIKIDKASRRKRRII